MRIFSFRRMHVGYARHVRGEGSRVQRAKKEPFRGIAQKGMGGFKGKSKSRNQDTRGQFINLHNSFDPLDSCASTGLGQLERFFSRLIGWPLYLRHLIRERQRGTHVFGGGVGVSRGGGGVGTKVLDFGHQLMPKKKNRTGPPPVPASLQHTIQH